MKNQKYEIERLAQKNSVLTSSNSAVMVKFEQLTAAMGDMKSQLKTLL